jgi:hypothetical protein
LTSIDPFPRFVWEADKMIQTEPQPPCDSDLRAFSEIEQVHWGKPGVTEQTRDGFAERVFVFQGSDGCPLAVLRLQVDTIVDVAVARPVPYPDEAVEALLIRAVQEGAVSVDLYRENHLQKLAQRVSLQWK